MAAEMQRAQVALAVLLMLAAASLGEDLVGAAQPLTPKTMGPIRPMGATQLRVVIVGLLALDTSIMGARHSLGPAAQTTTTNRKKDSDTNHNDKITTTIITIIIIIKTIIKMMLIIHNNDNYDNNNK